VTDAEKAEALLAIVQEVYDGGKQIIGSGWTVLAKMAVLAQANNVTGMVKYFENCKRSDKGTRPQEPVKTYPEADAEHRIRGEDRR
jgi:hypothetical protein